MKTLLIETSTNNCSVGLASGNELLTVVEQSGKRQHSEFLNVFIQEALKKTGWNLQEIEGVAVGKGPGSYTGLRIGVSTAKALCYALEIPLVGLSSLQILSQQLKQSTHANRGAFCPMLDARRMEVYTAIYDFELNLLKKNQALVLSDEVLSDLFDGHAWVHVGGEGAEKALPLLNARQGIEYQDIKYPSAYGMPGLANYKFKMGDTDDITQFEPFYLKEVAAGKQVKLQKFLNN
jgi:tRNA threonylcarbamoyladenosine biosynthesis protein TsaB